MEIKVATARVESPGQLAGLSGQLEAGLGGASAAFVLLFASVEHDLQTCIRTVQGSFPGAVVAGTSTAGEFSGSEEGKGAVTAFALGGDGVRARGAMAGGLSSDPSRAVSQAIPQAPPDPERPHRSAILLVDPLTGKVEEAVQRVAEALGDDVTLAGGAAADDITFDRTQVGVGGTCRSDALVVVLLDTVRAPSVGVMHGHMPITDWMQVTRAEGARLMEIDGKPAYLVWKDAVRKKLAAAGVDVDALSPSEAATHLLHYEFGIPADRGEVRIRAPLTVEAGDSIGLACAVAEGVKIRVMESSVSSQALSAQQAAFRARQGLGRAKISGALVFDCICRKLIMGERFVDALRSIQDSLWSCPIAGFKTYGEIARIPGEKAIFHQTTSVVMAFPE